ncbi:hypothetical protein [Rosettibacter firmus]|uniref:hypothetical protein n=1 Tax=Rosettibacter firmus TaxID=3111522 RepID=UPI00336BDBDF
MKENTLQFHNTLYIDTKRFTALWAFSEAVFGGILGILKVPFAGLLLSGAATIFISLIGRYSENKNEILHSTLLVILVKAVVSPYSSLSSYFAIALQGMMGYIFFKHIKNIKVSSILLGFFSETFSAVQRVLVLTILFGFTFWEALDSFTHYIFNQIGVERYLYPFSLSIFSVMFYIIIHMIAGIYIGSKVVKIPEWIESRTDIVYPLHSSFYYKMDAFKLNLKKKKKRWWKKPSGMAIIAFSILYMILSYYSKELGLYRSYEILMMLIRSVIITFVWFSIISPYIQKRFSKFLEKNKFDHAPEINKIIVLFPSIKRLINYAWFMSKGEIGIFRIIKFLSDTTALLLSAEIDEEQDLYHNWIE